MGFIHHIVGYQEHLDPINGSSGRCQADRYQAGRTLSAVTPRSSGTHDTCEPYQPMPSNDICASQA